MFEERLPARWRTSSYTGSGDCVELGQAPGQVGIRDTKDRDGGTLIVDRARFVEFLRAVQADRIG